VEVKTALTYHKVLERNIIQFRNGN